MPSDLRDHFAVVLLALKDLVVSVGHAANSKLPHKLFVVRNDLKLI